MVPAHKEDQCFFAKGLRLDISSPPFTSNIDCYPHTNIRAFVS
jgi:hypothetical protein